MGVEASVTQALSVVKIGRLPPSLCGEYSKSSCRSDGLVRCLLCHRREGHLRVEGAGVARKRREYNSWLRNIVS